MALVWGHSFVDRSGDNDVECTIQISTNTVDRGGAAVVGSTSRAGPGADGGGAVAKGREGQAGRWFLVVDHDGIFEGAFAKLFLEPGDPPNPVCSKCTDDRKDAPWLGLSLSAT